jgi:hypothetical protein
MPSHKDKTLRRSKTVTLRDARNQLSLLVQDAAAGHEVIITSMRQWIRG